MAGGRGCAAAGGAAHAGAGSRLAGGGMSEQNESSQHGQTVIRWAQRILQNGKARSWSHAIDLAATYAGEPTKPKGKGKTKPT